MANLTVDQAAEIDAMTCPMISKYGLGTVIRALQLGVGGINDGDINTAKLADSAVTTAKIADANVTPGKLSEIPFQRVGKITAAGAATPVILLADTDVPAGKKAYVDGVLIAINGATPWTDATGTKLSLVDNNGSPVSVLDVAKANLIANAIINMASTGVTLGANIITGVGLTAGKGISVKGDHSFAGSDIYVTIRGVIK